MNKNAFADVLPSCPVPETEVRLKLYCDESLSRNWLYIAMLILPEADEAILLQQLLNARCGNPNLVGNWAQCQPLCQYHQRNDTQLHWSQLRATQKDKAGLARRWLSVFLNEVSLVRAYVLGIDLCKLDQSYFGSEQIEENIYNRFFRTALLKATKSFFASYKTIRITEIIHDQSTAKQTHRFFDWQPIFRINERDDKVQINTSTITFLDSDHRRSNRRESHFLQFIDLIVNSFRQALDYESKDPLKEELARAASPLLRRLLEKPGNVRSSYKYVGRLKVEFFPKHDLKNLNPNTPEYDLKRWDCFHTNRMLMLAEKGQGLLLFPSEDSNTRRETI
jgi:hypothetical protein